MWWEEFQFQSSCKEFGAVVGHQFGTIYDWQRLYACQQGNCGFMYSCVIVCDIIDCDKYCASSGTTGGDSVRLWWWEDDMFDRWVAGAIYCNNER